jgi:serine/threonine-protein kinase
VLDIMDGLPAQERTVLVLAELQHDPPEAIAAALGLTRAEVEAKLVSARARFQHAFEERRAATAAGADAAPAPTSAVDDGVRLTARLAAGDVLAGRYRIDDVLGEGGMAIIYRATAIEGGETVAIKALHPETAASPPLRARLEREAEALAMVEHPHIVRLLESGTDPDGAVYLVMEFVPGKTLSQELERGALAMGRALGLFDQLLDALGALHEVSVVHRDLKPENVKVQRDGARWTAKLLDLGIARIAGRIEPTSKLTATGIAIGTPAYMPPEQAMGKEVSAPGDLYAATILLFEMITGQQPFFSHDMTTLLLMQVSSPPPLPSEVDGEREFSAALEQVVLTGLAKDPSDRPQTAADFRAALRQCPEWRTVVSA